MRLEERGEHSERYCVLALAVEGFFDLYRARARLAAGGDDRLTEKLLGVLPRSPERRKSPRKSDHPAPVATPPTP